MVLGSSASAQPTDPRARKAQVDSSIHHVRGDLSDTSAALNKAYDRLSTTRARLKTAKVRLATAQDAEAAAGRRYQDVSAQLEVARANEARAEEDLARTAQRLKSTRSRIAGFAAQMYQEQGMGELSIALDARTPQELAARLAMADTVMTVQKDAFEELATAKANMVAQEDHLSALRAEVAAAKARAQKALDAATAAREAAARAEAHLTALEATQTTQAADLKAQRAKERTRLKKLQAESRHLEKVLEELARKARIRAAKIAAAKAAAERERQRQLAAARAARARQQASTPAPPPATSRRSGFYLSMPVNAPTSSEFGYRFHPILHIWRLHAGLDFAAGCGTPIHAAASGTIISAQYAGGAGNQIVINNGVHRGVSLATVYDHMTRFAVTGGYVSRGQVIGYVGSTGLSTGCHLHFETRENGVPVNPRTWL